MDTLKKELKDELASIKGKSALIDHDSLQYMEKQFDFSIKGVLRDSESSESSANHLSDIKNELERTTKTGVSNVFFYESGSDAPLPAQLEKLANIYNVHFSPLDYVGDDLPKSIDVYQVCLRRIAVQIKAGFE